MSKQATEAGFWKNIGLFALTVVFMSIACNNPLETVKSTTYVAANMIDDAIIKLNNSSTSWQATLMSLSQDLQKIEKDAATDVDNILQRALVTTSSQFRCTVDFLRDRLVEDLRNIAARLRGQSPSPTK